jgi:hypothetical protein
MAGLVVILTIALYFIQRTHSPERESEIPQARPLSQGSLDSLLASTGTALPGEIPRLLGSRKAST